MKGLLVKDIRLMKCNKNSLVLVLAICVLYGFIYGAKENGVSTIFFMITFILTNLAIGTITMDMSDNGMAYIMTFPNARKHYVLEKYLFMAITILLSVIFGGLISLVLMPGNYGFVLEVAAIMFGMGFIYSAFSTPLFIKFGVEKGKIYLFIIAGAVAAIAYALMSLADNVYVAKIMSVVNRIGSLDMMMKVIGGVVVITILYVISMIISIRIMKKKTY